jgi:hypothetical protein
MITRELFGRSHGRDYSSRTKKITGKNAPIEMLRGSAGMTEIANEPKPRSKLLHAC